ncbi:MAG: hypothetical protein ACPG32_03335, partial [Akkermansiaceae bacterium]
KLSGSIRAGFFREAKAEMNGDTGISIDRQRWYLGKRPVNTTRNFFELVCIIPNYGSHPASEEETKSRR